MGLQRLTEQPSSSRSEKVNPTEDAHTYERVRQQSIHEEMSRGQERAWISSPMTGRSCQHISPLHHHFHLPLQATVLRRHGRFKRRSMVDSGCASYDLARQLREQDNAALRGHRRLVRGAARVGMSDCVICTERLAEDYSAPVGSCGHILCRTCMKELAQSHVAQAIWPVLCPTCVADNRWTIYR